MLMTCRDATFVTLVSQSDNTSTVQFASCFFGASRIKSTVPGATPPPLPAKPTTSPLIFLDGLSFLTCPQKQRHCYMRTATKEQQRHQHITVVATTTKQQYLSI